MEIERANSNFESMVQQEQNLKASIDKHVIRKSQMCYLYEKLIETQGTIVRGKARSG